MIEVTITIKLVVLALILPIIAIVGTFSRKKK